MYKAIIMAALQSLQLILVSQFLVHLAEEKIKNLRIILPGIDAKIGMIIIIGIGLFTLNNNLVKPTITSLCMCI